LKIEIAERAVKFLANIPDKDRRIVGEHFDRLSDHPHAHGGRERLNTPKERYRMHVTYRYTIFFYPRDKAIIINEIMTTGQAHKKYGRI
jgi:mRNA-degrading endonuclease RelE of RelBE toxin-antitoxin system